MTPPCVADAYKHEPTNPNCAPCPQPHAGPGVCCAVHCPACRDECKTPTDADLRAIVRDCGSIAAAVRYCRRIANVPDGPLTLWYTTAAELLTKGETA
jgi:hypothetical protein